MIGVPRTCLEYRVNDGMFLSCKNNELAIDSNALFWQLFHRQNNGLGIECNVFYGANRRGTPKDEIARSLWETGLRLNLKS